MFSILLFSERKLRANWTPHFPVCNFFWSVCFFLFLSPPRLRYRPFWPRVPFFLRGFLGVPFWALCVLEFLDALGTLWGLSSLASTEARFSDARRQGCLCRLSQLFWFFFPSVVFAAVAHCLLGWCRHRTCWTRVIVPGSSFPPCAQVRARGASSFLALVFALGFWEGGCVAPSGPSFIRTFLFPRSFLFLSPSLFFSLFRLGVCVCACMSVRMYVIALSPRNALHSSMGRRWTQCVFFLRVCRCPLPALFLRVGFLKSTLGSELLFLASCCCLVFSVVSCLCFCIFVGLVVPENALQKTIVFLGSVFDTHLRE